jgi:CRP-like cAMP-binding protein
LETLSPSLRKCALFEGLQADEISSLLGCIKAVSRRFFKGQMIISEDDRFSLIGIVVSGSVRLERIDFFGERQVIGKAGPSELFGEVFVFSAVPYKVDVLAATDCEILLLHGSDALKVCHKACEFHNQLVLNMVKIVSDKSLRLNEKALILSQRTTRSKILAFLDTKAKACLYNEFDIPYDRQELADYLGVERSAMSAELSRMKRDGLIDYHKNHFTLLAER